MTIDVSRCRACRQWCHGAVPCSKSLIAKLPDVFFALRNLAEEVQKKARLALSVEVLKATAVGLGNGLQKVVEDLAIDYPKGGRIGEAAVPVFWEPPLFKFNQYVCFFEFFLFSLKVVKNGS